MFNGLWTVEFISTMNRYGSGVVVFKDDRLLGGDDGYYYNGSCHFNGNSMEASIQVIKYVQNSVSVFGDINNYELEIRGEIDENKFIAIGSIANNPEVQIKIIGTKKEEL